MRNREKLRLAIIQRDCVGISGMHCSFHLQKMTVPMEGDVSQSMDGNVLQREAKQRLTDYQRSQLLEYFEREKFNFEI